MIGFEQDFIRAIRAIATKGLVDKQGNVLAASETQGYVVKIHDDPNDELYGTVDVREYVEDTYDVKDDEDIELRGLHEGVFLSAIQNFANGVYYIPKLYSDVTIVMDSITKREYVRTYNQVDILNYEAGVRVGIGVVEREEYSLDDGDEHEEKEETGNKSWTEYSKEKVETSVEGDDKSKSTILQDREKVVTTIENDGGDKVEITATSGSVEMKVCDKITISLKDGKISIEAEDVLVTSKKVKITGGQMEMAGMASTDMQGPFCAIPTCPFSGAPHTGKLVSNT